MLPTPILCGDGGKVHPAKPLLHNLPGCCSAKPETTGQISIHFRSRFFHKVRMTSSSQAPADIPQDSPFQDAASEAASAAPAATPAFSPLYRQIKNLLLARLHSGEWKPGESIPSEIDLAAQFRVSQGTVRKAIDELAAENLLMRRQGKGTFVTTHTERQVQYRFLKLLPDHDSPNDEGRAQRQILEFRRMRATPQQAQALQLPPDAPLIHIRRVLSFQGVPTILEDIWLPAHALKGINEDIVTGYQGPTYALLEEEFGVHMVRAEEKLKAVLPDAEAMRILDIPAHTALLHVQRLAFTYHDTPMELRSGLYRTDTHHYHNELG